MTRCTLASHPITISLSRSLFVEGNLTRTGIILASVFSATTRPGVAGPVFQGLGALPDGSSFSSRANAVSADGTTVVGMSRSAFGPEAFRWSFAEGMVGLGDLPGGDFQSEAFDVSADGSVIVGSGESTTGIHEEAFRWESGSMTGLGDFAGGSFFSSARGTSADGSVVVGFGISSQGMEAAIWSNGKPMTGLGDLPDGWLARNATAVSSDGLVVVGSVLTGEDERSEAFSWTDATGMVGLGASRSASAFDVSSDGSLIAGSRLNGDGQHGFRWTEELGMESIGDIMPFGMSMSGDMLVGALTTESSMDAAIWTDDSGVRLVEDLIRKDLGLSIDGWHLLSAKDVSADGSVIVGHGINPSGRLEAWVLVVPEPSTVILLFVGALTISRRRR